MITAAGQSLLLPQLESLGQTKSTPIMISARRNGSNSPGWDIAHVGTRATQQAVTQRLSGKVRKRENFKAAALGPVERIDLVVFEQ